MKDHDQGNARDPGRRIVKVNEVNCRAFRMLATRYRYFDLMKRLAVILAVITYVATLLGTAIDALPVYSLFGRVVAEISLAALAMTAAGYAMQESAPPMDDISVDESPPSLRLLSSADNAMRFSADAPQQPAKSMAS